jgi:hypothetical protein
MYNKIQKLPIVVISTFGHCASDWLGNLLDSHKEILIAPALSFFRKLEEIKRNHKINLNDLNDEKIANITVNKILKKSTFKSYNFFQNSKKKNIFKKYLKNYLSNSNEANNEKKLFYGIHYSYAKVNNLDISKFKVLVTHEHAAWHCKNYINYFNAKFLFIIRDPRATFAGSFRTFDRYHNFVKSHKLTLVLSFWIAATNFIKLYKKKNNVHVIKNEKINKNIKLEVKKLCKWMNISFRQILLKPTFLGKEWYGDSSYIQKFELKKKLPKNYYSNENVKKRWKNYLQTKEILSIETLLEKTMNKYNYKLENKLTIINRIRGYFYILFMHTNNESLIKRLISIIKNPIRRILIIKFNFYTK